MISAQHIFKKYGSKTVVSDVSLSVNPGEVLGFIGPNGAGKSTTIKIMSGVLPVYSGRVQVGDFDLSAQPRQAKSLIGYLPENAPLPPNMTVCAFLEYVAAMRGIPHGKRTAAVAKAVGRCSLQDVLNEEIESLSKGYKRRVCFAQAIIHTPKVLMMDEPTDGLDPNQKREIRNLIQLLRQDTAIIISTHILDEVRSVCTRVLLLAHGHVVFDGPTADFTALEAKTSGCALELAPDDLARASALMRDRFPGTGRLDSGRFIVPADRLDAVKALFTENTIPVCGERLVPATLDDVFATLTMEQKAPESKPVLQPQKSVSEDDDD